MIKDPILSLMEHQIPRLSHHLVLSLIFTSCLLSVRYNLNSCSTLSWNPISVIDCIISAWFTVSNAFDKFKKIQRLGYFVDYVHDKGYYSILCFL